MNKLPSFLDIYAAAAKTNLSLGSAWLQGVRRVRQCQINQINASSSEYAAALRKLESIDGYEALHTLQLQLIKLQMERASSYWSDIHREMGTLQGELVGQLQAHTFNATDALRQQVTELQSEATQSAASLLTPLFEVTTPFAFSTQEQAQDDGDDRRKASDHDGAGYAQSRKSHSKSASGAHTS